MKIKERILVVRGAFGDIYEPAWVRALSENGHEVALFDSHEKIGRGFLTRIEKRFNYGPHISGMRRDLMNFAKSFRPDITLLYQGHYFDHNFIEDLKKLTFVVGYHNDDPFGPKNKLLRYRLLNKAITSYEGYHFYRDINVKEAKSLGLKNSALLMPYYIPWMDYPRSNRLSFSSDLTYIGHYENDVRSICLNKVFRAGYKVIIRGENKYWTPHLDEGLVRENSPLMPVYGDEYRNLLSSAKIAACFLSKWNRDGYTRRAFEIPSCGSFMLSERTEEMMSLFKEDVHAAYFNSVDEFVDKFLFYVKNDAIREKIATQSRIHAINSGYDIHSRMRQWISDIALWKANGLEGFK